MKSYSPKETMALAGAFARELQAGSLVLLEGPLGAGKTTFVRGALLALGHEGSVRSPSYNLIQLYETSPPVLHADLYRLESATDLGLDEYADTHITLVEWAERDPDLATREHTRVSIALGEGDERTIEIAPYSGT